MMPPPQNINGAAARCWATGAHRICARATKASQRRIPSHRPGFCFIRADISREIMPYSGTAPHAAVVGPGRVGRALASFGAAHFQAPSRLIGRGEQVPDDHQGPIFVATQNDALEDVILQTPRNVRANLVFVQNGYFQPVLAEYNLTDNTQLLLYMSASEDGETVDGKQSVVCGRWAEETAAVLRAGGVACRVAEPREFALRQATKLLWSAIFWVVCRAHSSAPVGEVARHHRGEVAELAAELLPLALALFHRQPDASAELSSDAGVPTDAPPAEAVTADLCEYSLSIPRAVPSWDMAVAEFRWRNGALLGCAATPLHVEWLRRAGVPEELLMAYVAAGSERRRPPPPAT
mmetsp:Transcript_37984/g.96101  ORF Transcript_37984/g.96101 Transcript_37984/m.96101 type:complete len:350 (+) Transcript_37984:222-1271(+)